MISVIIPAHNEAAVIGRCLKSLTAGVQPGELEVIVVCNGCQDETSTIAQEVRDFVRVIETDRASKAYALNLGDENATGFPRFYVDADIVLSFKSIRLVCDELKNGKILAAAPRMDVDLEGCSWAVRAFYKVWLKLPYCRSGMIGSGVYALAEEGRKRFCEFPSITADDGFVRLLFKAQERLTVDTCFFTICPPKNLGGLIAIKTRSHFGNIELRKKYPEMVANEEASHGSGILDLARDVSYWPAIMTYVAVRFIARIKAHLRFYFGDHKKWERDETSRAVQV